MQVNLSLELKQKEGKSMKDQPKLPKQQRDEWEFVTEYEIFYTLREAYEAIKSYAPYVNSIEMSIISNRYIYIDIKSDVFGTVIKHTTINDKPPIDYLSMLAYQALKEAYSHMREYKEALSAKDCTYLGVNITDRRIEFNNSYYLNDTDAPINYYLEKKGWWE